jgi:hypothetical protein
LNAGPSKSRNSETSQSDTLGQPFQIDKMNGSSAAAASASSLSSLVDAFSTPVVGASAGEKSENMTGKREREPTAATAATAANSDSSAAEVKRQKPTQLSNDGGGNKPSFQELYQLLELAYAKRVLMTMRHHQHVLKKPFLFKKEQEDILLVLLPTSNVEVRQFMNKYLGYLPCFVLADVVHRGKGKVSFLKMLIRSPYDDDKAGQMVHKGLHWDDFIRNLKGDLINRFGDNMHSGHRCLEAGYNKKLQKDALESANSPVVICDLGYMNPDEYNYDSE